MSTKVAFVIESLQTGGAQRQLLELLRRINQTQYTSIVYSLCSIRDLEVEFQKTGIPVLYSNKRGRWDVTVAIRLARQMRMFRPDIVHTWLFGAGIWGRLAAYLAGVPYVISSERTVLNSTASGIYDYFNKALNRKTDMIIANSAAGRQNALRNTRRVTSVHVIYNGVDLERFDHTQIPSWREEGYRQGVISKRITIGTVGRLMPQKGHEILLEALYKLVNAGYDVQVVIVGGGPRLAELKRSAIELGLADRVFFMGERHDIPQMNALFDIFVLSSHWEGFPNVILEAMAMARPVVATGVAGVAEAVQDGDTGYVVPPNDPATLAAKLAYLLDHPKQAAEMGHAGRRRVEAEFSVETMVAQTTALYDVLMSTCNKKKS